MAIEKPKGFGNRDTVPRSPRTDEKVHRVESIRARLLKNGAIVLLLDGVSNDERRPEHWLPRIALSPDEAAQVLGRSKAWVWLRIKSGQIKSTKIAGCRLIPVPALIETLHGRVSDELAEPDAPTRPAK